MLINLEFAPSVINNAPVGFTAAVQAAAAALDSLLLDPIIVNISVGFGEIGGAQITPSISAGAPLGGTTLTYANFRQELVSHPTSPARVAMLANLPTSDPTGGVGITLSSAQEKAWGLLPADAIGLDGEVGFTEGSIFNYDINDRSNPTKVDFVGVVEHELAHALGRVTDHAFGTEWSVLDLTRYASPGVLASPSTATPYFSIDGGNTNLNFYDATNDPSDWAASAGADAFNAVSVFGAMDVTPADQALMNVLGFAVACFARGTRILTTIGEVAVERLRVGDALLTADGASAPVRWLGHRRMEPAPEAAWPMRIAAGAFGDGLPRRPLLLSPDHAIYLKAALLPARALINGASIRRVPVRTVEYWHLELDRHAVVFAEGLACESYLDTGNRGSFDAAAEASGASRGR